MLHSIFQETCIIWLSFMVQRCKTIIFVGVFFFFFQAKKWPKMIKILSWLISQEPYIIWLSFMLHICKLISSGVFFFLIFQNFDFLGQLKWQKMAQNDKKLCLSHSVSQELYIIQLWFLVHIFKMMISPAKFFIFQNFDFLGF